MTAQQSTRLVSQSHQLRKGPRWRFIIIVILIVLTVVLLAAATIFWVGLVHEKLPDILGAIFAGSGLIIGFIALVIGIPPFLQFLQERRAMPSSIPSSPKASDHDNQPQQQSESKTIDSLKVQNNLPNQTKQNTNLQQSPPAGQSSQLTYEASTQAPMAHATPTDRSNLVQLTSLQKDDLVARLLDISAMKDRTRRDRIVGELSFADSIQRTPDTTNRQDVLDIVNGCLNFSDDGDGLRQMIDRIKFHEGNSPKSLRLSAFVQNLH